MHIGIQLEAPEGLGCLASTVRYYYWSRNERNVALVWFYRTKTTRWRAGIVRIDVEVFEREVTASAPGIRPCLKQHRLPESIQLIDTDQRTHKVSPGAYRPEMADEARVQFRLDSIRHLLQCEEQVALAKNPLSTIASLSRAQGSKVHPWDLQYWYFVYVLHGHNPRSLTPATVVNGAWSREGLSRAGKKLGRPAAKGRRMGWPADPMKAQIIESYLKFSGLGTTLARIYRRALVETFGCESIVVGMDGRQLIHPKNQPFPSYGQYRYVLAKEFGLSNVQTTCLGRNRMRKRAVIDRANTTGRLSNLLEEVEVDAYRCNERPMSYRHETMPELVVARAICTTTGARIGIGFSLGGESKEAYRSMLWSMCVDKSLIAAVYGIQSEHLDWPMRGMCRSLLSDRGPAGQERLIDALDSQLAIKTMTPSYGPDAKPNVESSNPRSVALRGQPTFVQSNLTVASMMKQEILRAASENRSVSVADRLSPEMVVDFHEQALPATPQSLWRYLAERLRSHALPIEEDDAVRMFLKPVNVQVDRKGVALQGQYYNSAQFSADVHEGLVARGVVVLRGFTLSLVLRVMWVEVGERLYRLEALRRIRFDLDDLSVPLSELKDIARMRSLIRSRTAESNEAARVELESIVRATTGKPLDGGRRLSGNPGRGKATAKSEAAFIKNRTLRKKA